MCNILITYFELLHFYSVCSSVRSSTSFSIRSVIRYFVYNIVVYSIAILFCFTLHTLFTVLLSIMIQIVFVNKSLNIGQDISQKKRTGDHYRINLKSQNGYKKKKRPLCADSEASIAVKDQSAILRAYGLFTQALLPHISKKSLLNMHPLAQD